MAAARILVVEDEGITAEDLRDILTELGYAVTGVVSSGADAIRQVECNAPDLVLMDIRIEGDMDGVETARIIRERYQIPAVYLSAHADPETLDRAKLAEPLGYIIKPFQESELQASIEMALYKRQMDQQAQERERALTATLSAIGEGVISVDAEGHVTFLNPAAETWTGWEKQAALGKNVDEVFRLRGHNRAIASDTIAQVQRERALVELPEGCLLAAAQGMRPISGTAAPIRDDSGKVAGVVLVFGGVREDATGRLAAPADRAERPAASGFEIVFESTAMRQLMHFARRVAASEASTILLEGESGTGKDVLAKYLHHNSAREAEPFVAINCAAIPETLLESELFGYEKGAFTDARAQKKGILELANRGTVFLDEVGELSLLLQAKMLRVLEEQSFRRLGGVKDIQVDLRVIAATNRPLQQAVQQGRFRVDLFYRLNVIQMVVPPLRGRRDDILPLANHFVRSFNQRFKRDIRGVSDEAAAALQAHDWPGNVRELRNTIERAMVLEETEWLQSSNLGIEKDRPDWASSPGEGGPADSALEGMTLDEAEKTLLIRALEKTRGNQTQAARLLGTTRDTLRYKMKKYDLRSPAASSQ